MLQKQSCHLWLLLASTGIRAVMNQVTKWHLGSYSLGNSVSLNTRSWRGGCSGHQALLGWRKRSPWQYLHRSPDSFWPCHLHRAALSSLCRAGHCSQSGSYSPAACSSSSSLLLSPHAVCLDALPHLCLITSNVSLSSSEILPWPLPNLRRCLS